MYFFSTLKILEVKFSHFLFFKGYSIYVSTSLSLRPSEDMSFKRFHNLPMFRYPKGTTQIKLLKKKKQTKYMQFYLVSLGTFACSILRRLLYTSKDISHSQACPYPHFSSQIYSGNGDMSTCKERNF